MSGSGDVFPSYTVQQWRDPFSSSLTAEKLGNPSIGAENSGCKLVAHRDPGGPGSVRIKVGTLGMASFDSSWTRRIWGDQMPSRFCPVTWSIPAALQILVFPPVQ